MLPIITCCLEQNRVALWETIPHRSQITVATGPDPAETNSIVFEINLSSLRQAGGAYLVLWFASPRPLKNNWFDRYKTVVLQGGRRLVFERQPYAVVIKTMEAIAATTAED